MSRNLIVLGVFIGVAFLVFGAGLVATPRVDHLIFLSERALVKTDWEWLQHTLSFNRSRFIDQGDFILFRPITHGLLGLQDLLFRADLRILGAMSILMQAFAGFALYKLVGLFTTPGISFMLGILYVVQYAGMEIVTWRHISPYILALLFSAMGLYFLCRPEKKPWLGAVCLGAAAMTHEFALVASVLTLFLLLILNANRLRVWVYSLVGVSLVYGLLSLANGLAYVQNMPQSGSPHATDVFRASIFASVSMAFAFFNPFGVELRCAPRIVWLFEDASIAILGGTSGILAIIVIVALRRAIRRYRRGFQPAQQATIIWLLCGLGGLVLGLALGRIGPRGFEYFLISTYYLAMGTFLLSPIIAFVLQAIIHRLKLKSRPFFRAAVVAGVGALVAGNVAGIQKTLVPCAAAQAEFADSVSALDQYFRAHPGDCLAWVAPGVFEQPNTWEAVATRQSKALNILLRHRCHAAPGEQPLLFVEGPALVPLALEPLTGEVVAFTPAQSPILPIAPAEKNQLHQGHPDAGALVSDGDYAHCDFAVTVHAPYLGSVDLGDRYRFVWARIYGYEAGRPELRIAVPDMTEPVRVEIRHTGGDILFLMNQNIISVVPDTPLLWGKIRLLAQEYLKQPQTFTDPMVNCMPANPDWAGSRP